MPNDESWFRGVRCSKFRHVYGLPVKKEKCYDNINITKNAHDSQFCAVNPKFLAIVTEVAGGGAFIVIPIGQTGRQSFNVNKVTGHKGTVLDIKWNPFNDNVIASASDDCTVKLWNIPDSGLVLPLTDWLAELIGHKRRVQYIEWHPTAENVILSAGYDYRVIVWNIEKQEAINAIDCHTDVIYSMSLNHDGSLLATTSKDKKLRIIDPRSGEVKNEVKCHEGSRASKVVFLSNSNRLLTTGFSKHSDRQYSLWDTNNFIKPLVSDTIDCSSGILFPFYDRDTNMLYLAGKGDGSIRYYEITDKAPYVHFLSQFISGVPQRGLGFMPKRGLNVNECEIFRFYKLHSTGMVCEPISMIVPRKTKQFHEDLYPPTAAPIPSVTACEWIQGINKPPKLMSLKEEYIPLKPTIEKSASHSKIHSLENNKKKFAFLSVETTPDYRPKNVSNEKNQKTANNQSKKIEEIQKGCGRIRIPEIPKDFSICRHYGLECSSNENKLRKSYLKQSEELFLLRQQLIELDKHLWKLQNS